MNDTVINVALILAVVWVVQLVIHHSEIHMLVTGRPLFARRRDGREEPTASRLIHRVGDDR